MRGFKALLCTTALLAPLALLPPADAQISINIGAPPICSYGYYDYAPYACAPIGFYGPGYFYNGIFLGMGPWSGWGYSHGWGSHRFSNSGGGRYTGGFHGVAANRGRADRGRAAGRAPIARTANRGRSNAKPSPDRPRARRTASHGASHTRAAHGGSSHGTSHAAVSHDAAKH